MSDLQVGQVLSMRMRFNNSGTLSLMRHPYLIVNVEPEWIEVAQIDSIKTDPFKALMKCNKVLSADSETVIDKDSYVQLDNTMRIENSNDLTLFRRQEDLLSNSKLNEVIDAYNHYHENNEIDSNKVVFIDNEELMRLNGRI